MILHVGVYLRTRFQVSSIILTSFRQGIFYPSPTYLKTNPKKPTQIRVKLRIKCGAINHSTKETRQRKEQWPWSLAAIGKRGCTTFEKICQRYYFTFCTKLIQSTQKQIYQQDISGYIPLMPNIFNYCLRFQCGI